MRNTKYLKWPNFIDEESGNLYPVLAVKTINGTFVIDNKELLMKL